jgi:WD40 repeat protein
MPVECIAWLDDTALVSGSQDGSLRMWAQAGSDGNDATAAELRGHEGAVNCVSVLAPRLVAAGGDDCSLRLWDLQAAAW